MLLSSTQLDDPSNPLGPPLAKLLPPAQGLRVDRSEPAGPSETMIGICGKPILSWFYPNMLRDREVCAMAVLHEGPCGELVNILAATGLKLELFRYEQLP